jgi:hypothetical protein
VDAVHQRGLVAETHSTTPEGLRVSLMAGVDLVQHPEVLDVPISDDLVKMFVERGVVCGMLANTMTGKPWQDYVKRRAREDSARVARADSARRHRRAPAHRAELRRDRGDSAFVARMRRSSSPAAASPP